jgi:hypothetical protein
VLPIFEIPVKTLHLISYDFADKVAKADPKLQRFCQLIIILGLLLDGEISFRERERIAKFHKDGILEPTVSELVAYKNDFLEGRGIGQLADKYLG